MNFTPLTVGMFVVGVILIYAAMKNRHPKDVITDALKRRSTDKPGGKNRPRPETYGPRPGSQHDYPVTSV